MFAAAAENLTRWMMQGRMAMWSGVIARIGHAERRFVDLDAADLRRESRSLQYRARSGESLDALLPEAYGLARVAAQRSLGMRHYDVQLTGGVAMHYGCVAEMQTGEGKTLTATLPLYLAALRGRGAHLATANDYLARRDADWMRPLFTSLGLTVGSLEAETPPHDRKAAYDCDITYGTAKEFGFDFLRDRLAARRALTGGDLLGRMLGDAAEKGDGRVQGRLYFVLVDEADSILIDEARTPLVVSAAPGVDRRAERQYRWAAGVAEQFREGEHYDRDPERRTYTLSAAGRRLTRRLARPDDVGDAAVIDLYDHIERAVRVQSEFHRDRHYIDRDGEIVIVDEFTGRLSEGRKWRDGLHQAIEAKEGVEITAAAGDAARVTIQDFFRQYERRAGMTGTATGSDGEMRSIYGLSVAPIPTNRPPQRVQLPDRVFGVADEKWRAIVAEAAEMHADGRPVLIGTRSIDKSEHVSQLLDEAGIEHQVLNARRLAAEAEIVGGAGELGRVTVATNMAGRGTDIRLGDDVPDRGGLHVICTELHESARIDRQLIGRCGRQGDPGSYRVFMALDDEILAAGFGPHWGRHYAERGAASPGELSGYSGLFRKAQRNVETEHYRQRRMLMYFEEQRRKHQLQMGQDPYLDSPS